MTGNDLKALRESKKWTQTEMGAWLGYTYTHINRLERYGKLEIPDETRIRIEWRQFREEREK